MGRSKLAFVVFGAQGSGKSTQTDALADRYGLPVLSMGEQLRDLAKEGNRLGKKISAAQEKGELVDTEIVREVVVRFLEKTPGDGIIFDAFPRDISQLPLLEELAVSHCWKIIGINLAISDKTALERIGKRTIIVDGKVTRRDDDSPEAVKERLEIFHKETEPILERLRQSHTVLDIDGEPPIESVTKQMLEKTEQLLNSNN